MNPLNRKATDEKQCFRVIARCVNLIGLLSIDEKRLVVSELQQMVDVAEAALCNDDKVMGASIKKLLRGPVAGVTEKELQLMADAPQLRAQRDELLAASGALADAAKRVLTASSEANYRPELRAALDRYEATIRAEKAEGTNE